MGDEKVEEKVEAQRYGMTIRARKLTISALTYSCIWVLTLALFALFHRMFPGQAINASVAGAIIGTGCLIDIIVQSTVRKCYVIGVAGLVIGFAIGFVAGHWLGTISRNAGIDVKTMMTLMIALGFGFAGLRATLVGCMYGSFCIRP